MVNRCLLGALILVLYIQIAFAQEPQSLGDVARKVRAQKNGAASTAANASPDGSRTPAAARAAGPAGLQQSAPVVASATPAAAILPDLNPDVATDLQGLARYQAAIRQLFQQERFDEIDRIANDARAAKARFPGGFWKIHVLYVAISEPLGGYNASDFEWTNHLARLERWKSQNPSSITARVALGSFYDAYGWKARGGGYAGSVSEEGWRILAERAAIGQQVLEEAKSLPSKCPEWFLAMLAIARAEDWDDERRNALFEQALAFEPDYYYYYQDMAELKLPKWGGDEGDVAAFAETMANRIGGRKGDLIYYHIATSVICACDNTNGGYGMSWPRIQHGYAVLEELYGASIQQLNKIALIASLAGQPEYAKTLFARIGENWDVEVWRTRDYFANTKRWTDDLIAKRYYIEATENAKTPEGQSFTSALSAALTSKYHEKLIDCMKTTPDYDRPDIGVLLQLAKDGSVQRVILAPGNAPKGCFSPQLEKATLTPPPRDNYWAVVTMSVKR